MIRILVADDHPIIRKGVINILSSESDMKVVCEASNGLEVIDLVKKHDVDIVILDIIMPEMSGIQALEWLKKKHPKLPVIMVSSASEKIYISKTFKAGASGFISKENAHTELVFAIRKVMKGGIYYNESQEAKVTSVVKENDNRSLHSSLSRREYQIFLMIGAGKSLTDIGKELSLNVKTISTFRSRILQKMELDNNAEIIRYCMDEHLT